MSHFIPKIIGEVELDFNRDSLYVWQPSYDPLVVELMKRSVAKGLDIPPIDVVKTGDNVYELAHFRKEEGVYGGGHHRSILGLFLGKFKGNVREQHDLNLFPEDIFPIQEMTPISNDARDFYIGWSVRLQNSLVYLSEQEQRDFCSEYNLNPEEWGVGHIGRTLREIVLEKLLLETKK